MDQTNVRDFGPRDEADSTPDGTSRTAAGGTRGSGGAPAGSGGAAAQGNGGERRSAADAAVADATTDVTDASADVPPDACGSTCAGRCANLLDDPANCGACGHDCRGGACTSGTCRPARLATALAGFLQPYGDDVYWGAFTPDNLGAMSSIQKVAKTGGPVVTLNSDVAGVQSFAVSATNLYFVAGVRGTDAGVLVAKFLSMPVVGGAPSVLADADGPARGTVLADGRVYWGGFLDTRGVSFLAIGGGPVDGGARTGAFDGNAHAAMAVAVDARYVYWQATKPAPVLVRAPLSGGAVEPVQTGGVIGVCGDIEVRGDVLYCADYSIPRRLARVSLADPTRYLPPIDLDYVPRIATDDAFVYWIHASSNAIWRAKLDGTEITTVVSPVSRLGDLAVDETSVYWTELDVADSSVASGSVMVLAK